MKVDILSRYLSLDNSFLIEDIGAEVFLFLSLQNSILKLLQNILISIQMHNIFIPIHS